MMSLTGFHYLINDIENISEAKYNLRQKFDIVLALRVIFRVSSKAGLTKCHTYSLEPRKHDGLLSLSLSFLNVLGKCLLA